MCAGYFITSCLLFPEKLIIFFFCLGGWVGGYLLEEGCLCVVSSVCPCVFAPICVHQRRTPSRQCCCRWGWGAPWWAAVAERPALIKGPRSRRGGGERGEQQAVHKREEERQGCRIGDPGWWCPYARGGTLQQARKTPASLLPPHWVRLSGLYPSGTSEI